MEIDPAAVAAWPGVELVRALPGGARNTVLLARRRDRRLVVRRSARSPASLDWELDLLEHLTGHGVAVPRVVPADDGRRHVDGVLVQEFVDGRPPRDDDDWHRVIQTLTVVHRLTVGWPQRPGFASARELLVRDRGGDVRLDLMPAQAVRAVRQAWQLVLGAPECAIHGDVGAGNILVTDARPRDAAGLGRGARGHALVRLRLPASNFHASRPGTAGRSDHRGGGLGGGDVLATRTRVRGAPARRAVRANRRALTQKIFLIRP